MNKPQSKQYELLLEVDRICKKYNIKYTLSSGTLLGAVRHKGFIPWDDDLDIDMVREEYDKFKKAALKELNPKYFYQDMETDRYYGLPFAKIRMNNTKYIEEIAKDNKSHNGIYIDIFPIDHYNSSSPRDLRKVIFLRMLLLLKTKYIIKTNTFVKKIELIILKFLTLFVSKESLVRKINRIIDKNKNGRDYVVCFATTFFDKWPIENVYKEYIELEFEGRKFPCIKEYDKYLTKMYGDYMELPPVEKRRSHDIVEIDYGEE